MTALKEVVKLMEFITEREKDEEGVQVFYHRGKSFAVVIMTSVMLLFFCRI